MCKKLVFVEVRGRQSEWGINWYADNEQIEAMRADGIEIFEVENTVPAWIADIGMTAAWCAIQDIWNLKNPFRRQ